MLQGSDRCSLPSANSKLSQTSSSTLINFWMELEECGRLMVFGIRSPNCTSLKLNVCHLASTCLFLWCVTLSKCNGEILHTTDYTLPQQITYRTTTAMTTATSTTTTTHYYYILPLLVHTTRWFYGFLILLLHTITTHYYYILPLLHTTVLLHTTLRVRYNLITVQSLGEHRRKTRKFGTTYLFY